MANKYTPLVISDDGKQHIVAPEGSAIDNAYLVSSQQGNAIVAGSDDKLYVAPVTAGKGIDIADNEVAVKVEDLISATPLNSLTVGIDGKLTVAPTSVSTDSGNIITVKDNGLFAEVTAGTGIKVVAGEVSIDAEGAAQQLVSMEDRNALTLGADNKLYVSNELQKAENLISTTTEGNMLSLDSTGLLKIDGNSVISNGVANNLLTINQTDKLLQVDGDTVLDFLNGKFRIVSHDAGNILREGSDHGAFLNKDLLPDPVSAGEGITVDGGEVSVKYGKGLTIGNGNRLIVDEDNLDLLAVEATDKILSVTSDKKLSAAVSADYDGNTGYFYLYGKDRNVLSSIYIPGATSALANVVLVDNPEGYDSGKYFKYTFAITSTGGTTDLYVKVPIELNVSAGNGLNLTETDQGVTLSVKPKANGGLAVDGMGVYISENYAKADDLTALTERVTTIEDDSIPALEQKDSEQDNRLTAIEAKDVEQDGRLDDLEDANLSFSKFSSSPTPPDTSRLENQNGVFYPSTDLLNW